jgi:hypothetical protein
MMLVFSRFVLSGFFLSVFLGSSSLVFVAVGVRAVARIG